MRCLYCGHSGHLCPNCPELSGKVTGSRPMMDPYSPSKASGVFLNVSISWGQQQQWQQWHSGDPSIRVPVWRPQPVRAPSPGNFYILNWPWRMAALAGGRKTPIPGLPQDHHIQQAKLLNLWQARWAL